MFTPRLLLTVGLLLAAAGGAISLHSAYLEGSGRTEAVSLAEPSSSVVEFRPHASRVHFVSLLIDETGEGERVACLDSRGFPQRDLDVQWVMEQDGIAIASGLLASSPLEIHRGDHQALVLGGFFASTDHVYTLKLRSRVSCPDLAALHPRIEIGLRPGRPGQVYFVSGYALMFLGLGVLVRFTRRDDKGWPYRPIQRRWARWRGTPNA